MGLLQEHDHRMEIDREENPSPSSVKRSLIKNKSSESLESFSTDADETKKKMLQGFDEEKDQGEMVCKISKDLKLTEDEYENISDINAFSIMFPVHKASKFGGKI